VGAFGEGQGGGSLSVWIGESGEGGAWFGFCGCVLVGRPGGEAGRGSGEKKRQKSDQKAMKK